MGKPKDSDVFGGDGRERSQSIRYQKALRQLKELDTARSKERPEGNPAASLAAWGKWFTLNPGV